MNIVDNNGRKMKITIDWRTVMLDDTPEMPENIEVRITKNIAPSTIAVR